MTSLWRWPSCSWLILGIPGACIASWLGGDSLAWDLAGMVLGAVAWFALMFLSATWDGHRTGAADGTHPFRAAGLVSVVSDELEGDEEIHICGDCYCAFDDPVHVGFIPLGAVDDEQRLVRQRFLACGFAAAIVHPELGPACIRGSHPTETSDCHTNRWRRR